MVIKINYTSSDVYVSTSVSPVYVVVNYSAVNNGGGAVWGGITGTLSDQTDLQNALNAKFDDPTGTTSQYLRGDGSLATFPTIPSGTVTSVGLTMPSAFSVANSPVTSSGTLAVTGAGTASQYIRGDGQLANFPDNGGGGSSVNYYLNGSVNQGTFGGDTYYEMSKTPILGAGTNFTRTNGQGNGYIASFITDAGDPSLLNIPGGNWNLEFYFASSASGGSPQFYGEIYKVSSSNVFTLVASGSSNPEGITNGTTVDQYFTSIPVPQTSLLVTDRLAVRIYVIPAGRTITLHTEDGNLCEVLTTLSTGLNALNGLTSQVQYFATGTSGTDFAISSATDTHTFNLPTASATNRGALSSADWSTFSGKVGGSGATGQVAYWNGTGSQTGSNNLFWDNTNARLGIGTNSPTKTLDVNGLTNLKSLGASYNPILIVENTGTASDANKNVALFIGARGNASSVDDNTNVGIWQKNNTVGNFGLLNYFNSAGGLTAFIGVKFVSHSGTPSGDLVFGLTSTVPTERMRLTSAGRLLLGTTSEGTFLLDVNGTARVSGDALVNGLTVGKGLNSIATNTAVGASALAANTTGNSSTAIGYESLKVQTTGTSNTGLGYRALWSITTGTGNTAIGSDAMVLSNGSNNAFVGATAGRNTSGSYNVYVGVPSTSHSISGNYNVGIGGTSSGINVSGSYNIAVGALSLASLTSGSDNTAIGTQTLNTITTGTNSIAVGYQALFNSTASYGIGIGSRAGFGNTTGTYNIYLGQYNNTGSGITTGSYNTIIGSAISGLTAGLSNNIILADGQGNIRIRAFDTGNVTINSNTDAGFKLDVNGTARVSGGLTISAGSTLNWNNVLTAQNRVLFYDDGNSAARTGIGQNAAADLVNFCYNGKSIFFAMGNDATNVTTANASAYFDGGRRLNLNYNLLIPTGTKILMNAGNYGAIYSAANIGMVIEPFDLAAVRPFIVYQNTGGSVGIGDNSAGVINSAQLFLNSTTKGFLPPRGTNTQMLAIASPATGLMFYDTTNNKLNVYDGTTWQACW